MDDECAGSRSTHMHGSLVEFERSFFVARTGASADAFAPNDLTVFQEYR